jgi:hypothetical protein
MKLPPQVRTLKAIKPHKYGTRHLTAGEEYEVPSRHAFALVAARKAQFVDKRLSEKSALTQAARDFIEYMHPKEIIAKPMEPPPDIDSLRLQATSLGINVDGRWGVARLQYEIEQAKG